MRMWIQGAVAAALLLPTAAQAQGVKLAQGEEVSFTLDNGKPGKIVRNSATPTPFEVAVGTQYSGMKPPEAPLAQGTPIHDGNGLPKTPEPEAGKLRFRFLQVPHTDHSMLIVHNGYGQGLLYRATITANGKSAPTDVCLVMPGKSGVEHWPYAISAIEVSSFELVPWKPEDGIPCK